MMYNYKTEGITGLWFLLCLLWYKKPFLKLIFIEKQA